MHIVVIEGTDRLIDKALAQGCAVTFIGTSERFSVVSSRNELRAILVPALDQESVTAAVTQVHRQHPVTAVISLTEFGVLPAAVAAAAVGARGISATAADLLGDKVRMRHALAGRWSVPYSAANSAVDVSALITATRAAVILKPRGGTASRAVFRIGVADNAEMAWHEYRSEAVDDAIVESFAEGPEFSVEAFTHDGHHHIVACTEKLLADRFVELGHALPARLPRTTYSALQQVVEGFLDVMQVTYGATHTEVRITKTGIVVIESHNRIGGDKIGTLVEHATGIDLVDLTVRGLGGGLPCEMFTPTRSRAAAIRFVSTTPGSVVEVAAPSESTPSRSVFLEVRPGDVIGPLRSSHDRVGWVIAQAETVAEAIVSAESAAAAIMIRTEPIVAAATGITAVGAP